VKDEEVSRLQRSRGCYSFSHSRPSGSRRTRRRPRFQWPPWIPQWSSFSSAAIFRLGHRGRLDGPGGPTGSRGDTAVRSGIAHCRTARRSEVRVSAKTELTEPRRFAHGDRAAWLADRSAIVSGRSLNSKTKHLLFSSEFESHIIRSDRSRKLRHRHNSARIEVGRSESMRP
jgi:hypothetical protein